MARGFHKQRKIGSWRSLALHTWRSPSSPAIYGTLEIDATRALAYLGAIRERTGVRVTMTHLVGKAVAAAIAERPDVNAVIRRGFAIYLRESVDVFFQIALDAGEDLSGAKISGVDRMSIADVARELEARADRIRAHRDREVGRSTSMLNRLPMALRGVALRAMGTLTYDLGLDLHALGVPFDQFGSAMVTNVGMYGLPAGLAPLVPFARTPIIVTVGAIEDRPRVVDGEVVVRPVLSVGATLDHRLLDGYQASKLVARFRVVLEDPGAELAEMPSARAARSRAAAS